jgi:hypothetical protein
MWVLISQGKANPWMTRENNTAPKTSSMINSLPVRVKGMATARAMESEPLMLPKIRICYQRKGIGRSIQRSPDSKEYTDRIRPN